MKALCKVLFGIALLAGIVKVAQVLVDVIYEQTNRHYISVTDDE